MPRKPPINIKEILDARGDSATQREAPVHIAIFVDVSAPEGLVSTIKHAFNPIAENAFLHIEPFKDVLPELNAGTDLAVIVAGRTSLCGELHEVLDDMDITSVVACMTMTEVINDAQAAGHPLSPLDVVAFGSEEGGGEDEKRFLFTLGDWIVDKCKDERLALAAAFPFIRRSLALEITKATSFQNGIIGAVMFIPGADLPIMTLNQAKMVLQIAAAYGEPLGFSRLKELAVVVGGGFACRTAARELVSLMPAIGWAIKGGVGYSGTLAMGYAALEYFDAGCEIAGLGERMGELRDKALEQTDIVAEKRQMVREISRRAKERIDVDIISVSDAITEKIGHRESAS